MYICRLTCLCLVIASALVSQSPPPAAEWISVVGSSTRICTWAEGVESWYAVSLDGGLSLAAVRQADTRLHLRHARFDPLDTVPVVPGILALTGNAGLHVVQFPTRIVPGYRESLEDLGAEVVHFMPAQALLVRMTDTVVAKVRQLRHVRWVGPFQPAWRVEASMLRELVGGTAPARYYNVMVCRSGLVDKQVVRDLVISMGGETDPLSPNAYLLRARLDAAQLLEVVRLPQVLFVDRWGAPEVDVDIARELGGANYVENLLGYSGQGVRAEVMDSGLLTSHPNYQTNPPLIHGANGSSLSHGTSVYGIVFGDGVDNPNARGLLPDGQGMFTGYSTFSDRYAHTGELVNPALPWRAVFQTNSWGDPRTFFYTTVSADMDTLLFDHDIIITQSQSNAGNQDSRPQAWAKNIVSVGAFRHQDTLTPTDDCWDCGSSAASIGPASDGRIKPDISFFYDNILTTSYSGGYTLTFGGTSGATPLTAGHMGIIFQMWGNGIFGNPISGTDIFDNRPHMTTAKALMLCSAAQYPFTGTTHDLTRVHQGWGRPDLANLLNSLTRIFVVDETDVLLPLGSTTYNLTVPAGETELRACMIFADPAGNPAAAQHRINDLTLKVTDPSGTIYYGNNGLLAATTSTSGGTANTIDTVEQVIIANPAPGAWTIEVSAPEIIQDGHVETGALDADYALVVMGIEPPGLTTQPGQPNSVGAGLLVGGGLNASSLPALNGIGGPFFSTRTAGDALTMTFKGPLGADFLLLAGPLNTNNLVLPSIGSLDIGLLGGVPSIADVAIVLDGTAPTGFLNSLANTGPGGTQSLSFTMPTLTPGILGTLQAAFIDPVSSNVILSAATQVTLN